jgi:hypothetical protein
MSEHARVSKNGHIYQFCDSKLYAVIDTHTGELQRFSKTHGATGTYAEAIAFAPHITGNRLAIIELNAIVPFLVEG